MTSLREKLRRLLVGKAESRLNEPRVSYSYRIYWTKVAREWSPEMRRQVALNLRDLFSEGDFSANPFRRRYRLPALGESEHAGASLVALAEVLEGLESFETDQ